MPIYFAHIPSPTKKQTVSDALKDRGLELVRAKPCAVSVITVVTIAQPAYSCYVSNLHAFMEANYKRRTVLTSVPFIEVSEPSHLIPLTMPRLIYEYNSKITDARRAELLALGSLVSQGGRKGDTFFMTNPTIDKVRALMNHNIKPSMVTRHITGSMNIKAYKVALMIQKLLSAFLLTHVYPAFRDSDAVSPPILQTPKKNSANKKRKIDDSTCLMLCDQDDEDSSSGSEEEEKEETMVDSRSGHTITLQRAKPTVSNEKSWGTDDAIPNADGLYFPYISDLTINDERTVPDVIQRYFVRSLGNDLHAAASVLNELTSSWGVLKETALGNELSHIFRCLDISLQAQAVIYPVFSSQKKYEGCVMWGTGYTLCMNDSMYVPVNYNDLLKEVRDGSMHSKALRDIANILGTSDTADISECTTVRGLSYVVRKCELSVIQQTEVVEAASCLCFDNRYWNCQPIFLKRMFTLYTTLNANETIDADVPMHPSMLFATDKDELVLSAFGYQAPTFLIPNGRLVRLEKTLKGICPITNFYVRSIELKKAIADMRYVRENGTITNDNNTLSNRHRDFTIRRDDKKTMWKMLVDECGQVSQNTKATATTTSVRPTTGGALAFGF